MRNLSIWAKHHRLAAIVSIIIIKLLLAVMAFYAGSALLDLDVHLPMLLSCIAVLILVAAVLGYPSRWSDRFSRTGFYWRQKTCDFAIGAGAFLMIATLVNNNLPVTGASNSLASHASIASEPTAEEILASLKYRDKSTLTRHEKKILKEEFKKQLKTYVVAKITGRKNDAGKAMLIAVTIIAALGLLYLLAALACSLSCNGSDAAAVIVGLLGTVAIVWGAAVLIRRISRGPKKKVEANPLPAN